MNNVVSEIAIRAASRYFDIPISEFLQPALSLLSHDSTYADAIRFFLDPTIHTVFIVDTPMGKHLIGLISRSDMISLEPSFRNTPPATISEFMQTDVVVLRPNNTVGDALKVFSGQNPLHRRIRQVPIVDPDTRLLGYVDSDSLIRRILPST